MRRSRAAIREIILEPLWILIAAITVTASLEPNVVTAPGPLVSLMSLMQGWVMEGKVWFAERVSIVC